MHFGCTGPILLGTVAISVALATMEPDVKMKKHKMCEHLCNICYATKDKEMIHVEKAVNCSEGKEIYRTRGYVIKCRPIQQSRPNRTLKEDKTEGRMTRILMMPHTYGPLLSGRQLYLANNSVATYPFLEYKRPQAIAYIPSQRELVLSTTLPRLLVLVPVDDDKKTVLKTKYEINGIAIDDEKRLMFMNIIKPKAFVGVMKTYGKNLTILIRLVNCDIPAGIVADHKRSLIYVLCFESSIMQFTYQGVSKGHMAGIKNGGEVLSMQGDYLYHVTITRVLVKVSLSDHSVTELTTMKLRLCETILNVGNIVYVSPRSFTGYLLVFNESDIGTVTKLTTGFAGIVNDILSCLIA